MTRSIQALTLIILMAGAALLVGCSDNATAPQSTTASSSDDFTLEELKISLSKIPLGDPSETEIADLKFMREEEKLAYDVYTAMFDQYDVQIFSNISISELKHSDAVKMLLDRYEQDDPVGDNGPGEFTNADLQTFYNDLIASGSLSLTDALLVGLEIEEVDILDLVDAMARTELPDILKVYGHLLAGSHNHLRAFASHYEANTGEVYVPRWLSQEYYDEILSEDSGRGRRGSRQTGGC